VVVRLKILLSNVLSVPEWRTEVKICCKLYGQIPT